MVLLWWLCKDWKTVHTLNSKEKLSWGQTRKTREEGREKKGEREIFHIQPNENFEMPLPFKLSFRKKESLIKVQLQAYNIYLFLYYSSKWPWWWEVYWQDQTTVVVKLYRNLPFLSTAVCCMHFECLTCTDGWLTFYQPIRNAVWSICRGTEFKNPRGIEYRCFFFLPIAPRPLPPHLVVGQGFMNISHFTNHKRKTKKNQLKGEVNSVFQRTHWITDYTKSHCL